MLIIKSKVDRAWLAGILDTDGSLYIRKYTTIYGKEHAYMMIMFYNNNRQLLEKISSIIPGNIHFHYRKGIDKRGIKRSSSYTFTLSRKVTEKVLKELLPFLIVKRKKALLYLKDWRW